MKKHKLMKKFLITIAAILLICGIGIFALMKIVGNFIGSEHAPVADYDKRIEIWNTVAGNNSRSKLEDMNIDYDENIMGATFAFIKAIVNTEYADAECIIDTFTYLYEIKGGYEKESYEDMPYLIPYMVEDSKGAVIVIPGGGYGYKSMDGSTGEGKDIALTLNQHGYSAFVLHYRSNPYEYPIPQLDVQRAVRYLRANAEKYGFDPENIALIGFSAGGNQVGSYINLIMGNNLFPEDYTPDAIDVINDSVQAAGMIYPALSYNVNVPMLFCSFSDKLVRDEVKRSQLLLNMDLSQQFNSEEIPQLVSYGTSDGMVGMDESKKYIEVARENGADITEIVAEGQDHGFGQQFYMDEFVLLLNRAFDGIQTENP